MPPPPLSPAPALPPTLPEELLEEIFLRLPPDDPACLVRACLASHLWLGLLTGPAFNARYRDFHGAPPMLGFFYFRHPPSDFSPKKEETEPLFISTTRFNARISSQDQGWDSLCVCNALDCRHGRVVLGDRETFPDAMLTVSDPMTGRWWPLPEVRDLETYGAAVLCAVAGCDHRACHAGPFRVLVVRVDNEDVASVWLSSPETAEPPSSDFRPGDWVKACSGFHIEGNPYMEPTAPVLVQDGLHFMLLCMDNSAGILKYNLSSNSLSLIDAPPLNVVDISDVTILMAMEDGSLGFACVDGLTLYLWSRQLGSDGVASWTECKVINLGELLPILDPKNRLTLIGSVEGRDIIFVTTDIGICEINLKTLQWKKIWKREDIRTLVPCMSFYHPEEL